MSEIRKTPTPFVSSDVEKPPRERRRLGLRYGASAQSGFSTALEANGQGEAYRRANGEPSR